MPELAWRMAFGLFAVMVLAAQPACRENGGDAGGPEPDCARKVRALRTWLDAMVQDLRWAGGPRGYRTLDGGERVFEQDLARAPWRAGGPPVDASTELRIPAGDVAPWNKVESNFVEMDLVSGLQQDITRHEKLFPDAGPALVDLIVDARAPWSRVVLAARAVRRVADGRVQLLFVPEAHRHAEPPPSASRLVTHELLFPMSEDGKILLTPKGQPTPADRLFEEIVVGCPELRGFRREWKAAKYGNPGVEDAFLLQCDRDLPRALAVCNCAAEIPALQNLLWMSRSIPLVARRVHLVTPDDSTATCAHIAAKENTPWARLAPAILATPMGKALCFELQAEPE